jgi:hypothetical protein
MEMDGTKSPLVPSLLSSPLYSTTKTTLEKEGRE